MSRATSDPDMGPIPTPPRLCRHCKRYVPIFWDDGMVNEKLSHLPAWRFREHGPEDGICEGSLRIYSVPD